MKRHTLPNGLYIVCQSPTEADFFYDDIFAKKVYARHDVGVPPDATVFDVGANVGMFMLFVHYHAVRPRIFSFEPAPPLYALLQQNAATHGVNATLLNVGVSDAEGTAQFTFYPNSSGMSTFHGDLDEERSVLRRIMDNQAASGMAGMQDVMTHADDLLAERFRSSTFTCSLRPLRDVIAEHAVDRIDLLKVDVQKCEHEVLAGLGEANWPKVQQLVVEVHDEDGRLAALTGDLTARGFSVVSEQDDLYRGTNIHNLYATR